MSAAAADPALAEAAPARGGKKKLLVLVALVLVLVLAGGAAAMFLLKKKAPPAEDGAEDETAVVHKAAGKSSAGHPPAFLPLEPFVVNLADRDADRYAQVGVVLEVDSALFADEMKAYMPAIRNAILMILAHKNSRDLLERAGKEQLAEEIMRETVRPMGIDIPVPKRIKKAPKPKAEGADDEAPDEPVEAKAEPRRGGVRNPVRHVHFSSFIIQ